MLLSTMFAAGGAWAWKIANAYMMQYSCAEEHFVHRGNIHMERSSPHTYGVATPFLLSITRLCVCCMHMRQIFFQNMQRSPCWLWQLFPATTLTTLSKPLLTRRTTGFARKKISSNASLQQCLASALLSWAHCMSKCATECSMRRLQLSAGCIWAASWRIDVTIHYRDHI